jgi:tetratricopeptide (TPR) repeat protein
VTEERAAIAAIEDDPDQRVALSRYEDGLGNALERQGRLSEAVALHARALDLARSNLGASHPDVITRWLNYGLVLTKQGDAAAARTAYMTALGNMPADRTDGSLDAGIARTLLSDLDFMANRFDDAVAEARKALAIYQRIGASDHRLAEAYASIGNAEIARHHFPDALAMYEQALALRRDLGPNDFQIGLAEGAIGEALTGLGRYVEASGHIRSAEQIFARGTARDPAYAGWIAMVHGEALVGQQEYKAAIAVLERALPDLDRTPYPRIQAKAKAALARALYGLGQDRPRARALAEQARALFATVGPTEAASCTALDRLIERLSR